MKVANEQYTRPSGHGWNEPLLVDLLQQFYFSLVELSSSESAMAMRLTKLARVGGQVLLSPFGPKGADSVSLDKRLTP